MFKDVEKALADLKAGKLIVVVDDDDREAEGDLVGLAELASADNVNFMTKHARGLICAPVAKSIADRLELVPMSAENTDAHGTAFTISVTIKKPQQVFQPLTVLRPFKPWLLRLVKLVIFTDLGICFLWLDEAAVFCNGVGIQKLVLI